MSFLVPGESGPVELAEFIPDSWRSTLLQKDTLRLGIFQIRKDEEKWRVKNLNEEVPEWRKLRWHEVQALFCRTGAPLAWDKSWTDDSKTVDRWRRDFRAIRNCLDLHLGKRPAIDSGIAMLKEGLVLAGIATNGLDFYPWQGRGSLTFVRSDKEIGINQHGSFRVADDDQAMEYLNSISMHGHPLLDAELALPAALSQGAASAFYAQR